MSDEGTDTPKKTLPETETPSLRQKDKPVPPSASPAGEDEAAQKGEARPTDPHDADDALTHASRINYFSVLVEGAVMAPDIAKVDADRDLNLGLPAWNFSDKVLHWLLHG